MIIRDHETDGFEMIYRGIDELRYGIMISL